MGYVIEPKGVDLVVSPSVFTEQTKNKIARAIAEYKKTGQKPVNVKITVKEHTPVVPVVRSL